MAMMNQTLSGSDPDSITDFTSPQDPIFTLGDATTFFFIATTIQVIDATTTTIMTDVMAMEDIITVEEGVAIIETEATEATEDAIKGHAGEATEAAAAVAVVVEEAADAEAVVADNS